MLYLLPNVIMVEQMPEEFHLLSSVRRRDNIARLRKIERRFAIDNDVFTGRFDETKWKTHLRNVAEFAPHCLFVVAPDVLHQTPNGVRGDATATLAQYPRYRDMVRSFGYPVAFVAQDGMNYAIPDCDYLFIGGSTEFKYSQIVKDLVHAAHCRGIPVHMGRVNTRSRIAYCKSIDIDSVDGTHACFKPTERLRQLRKWMAQGVLC